MSERKSRISKPFIKQSILVIAISLNIIAEKTTNGFTSIFLKVIRKADSGFYIDKSMEAWLGGSIDIGIIIGSPLLFPLLDRIGRKKCHLLTLFPLIVGWIAVTIAKNSLVIILARILQGIATGLRISLSSIIIGECTAPKYRGFFLGLTPVAMTLGVIIPHVIGTFYSYKVIALVSNGICLVSLIMIIFIPDSPTYLVKVGQQDNAYKAFKWFRGTGDNSNKEFEAIVINNGRQTETVGLNTKLYSAITSKEFYQPLTILVALSIFYQGSGVSVMSHYTLDFIGDIFNSDSASNYTMIFADFLRLISSVIGSLIIKKFKRRTVLHASAAITIFSLASMSLYNFVQKKFNFQRDELFVASYCLYVCGVGCGLQAMTYVLLGELFPTNFKALGGTVAILVLGTVSFVVIFTGPYMFRSWDRDGTFLAYGFLTFSAWLVLYFKMPETKNRTLIDIELDLRGLKDDDEEMKTVTPLVVK